MLRNISGDLEGKQYTHKAKELARPHHGLLEELRRVVRKENKKAAEGICSVIQTGATIRIRATSRTAMSELYTVQAAILKSVKKSGFESVRFTV